jgi:hypothetical protein
MRSRLKIAIISAGVILATQAAAQVTLYEGEEFTGARFRVDTTIRILPLWDSMTARRRRSSSRDVRKCARTRNFAAAARF